MRYYRKRKFTLAALVLQVLLIFFFSDRIQNPQPLPDTKIAVNSVSPIPQVAGESSEIIPTYKVVRVIDGDTVELEDGRKVRYIGINAPETNKDCFALEATLKNKELVEGKRVRMEKDRSETDRYGRLLRYVYVDDLFINDELVKGGYAYAKAYRPDTKLQEKFTNSQSEAMKEKRGLWGKCSPAI